MHAKCGHTALKACSCTKEVTQSANSAPEMRRVAVAASAVKMASARESEIPREPNAKRSLLPRLQQSSLRKVLAKPESLLELLLLLKPARKTIGTLRASLSQGKVVAATQGLRCCTKKS